AFTLVGDVQRADDLTQDTWVSVLESPPRTDLPLRGWLATVMRNRLRQDHRGQVRRGDKDAHVALEPDAATDETGLQVLERVTMQ
ncbi:RNA polymerase sigma factor, partial [Escherichia coli]|uniref:RNA polymerase sigma factor n=1 Tax=Escherichia coli TaxID=562 RepID=UPI001AA0FAEC